MQSALEALKTFDDSGFRSIHVGLHSAVLDHFFLVLSYMGLSQIQIPMVALFWINNQTRGYVWPLVLTIAISGLPVAQGLKSIIVRDRPSNLWYAKPQEAWLANSFPSGHTTTSFAIATLLLFLTWNTPRSWLGPAALVWATLVGVSRIYRGVHWPTDVIAGACCGAITSAVLYLIINPKSNSQGRPDLSK